MKKTTLLFFVLLFCLKINAQNGLIGEYFSGENFDKKVMTRNDASINFNWGFDGPGNGIDATHFSIKWAGKIYVPVSGEYFFSAKVDDGIRLWVNGQALINAWGLHDAVDFNNKIYLKGPAHYEIRVEYYNGMRNALINLLWKKPQKKSILNYFSDDFEPIGADYLSNWGNENKPIAAKVEQKPIAQSVKLEKNKEVPKAQPIPVKPTVIPPPAKPEVNVQEKKTMTQKARKELEPKFIYFVKGKNEILETSQLTLNQWVVYMEKIPDAVLKINGYTDNIGDEKMNQKLSEERATVVQNYLISKGVAPNRLQMNGFGGNNPVFKNPITEKERSLNRRVEVKVGE
jgi:outer membrane protein OmpA-like peptidoglycan-associated protein